MLSRLTSMECLESGLSITKLKMMAKPSCQLPVKCFWWDLQLLMIFSPFQSSMTWPSAMKPTLTTLKTNNGPNKAWQPAQSTWTPFTFSTFAMVPMVVMLLWDSLFYTPTIQTTLSSTMKMASVPSLLVAPTQCQPKLLANWKMKSTNASPFPAIDSDKFTMDKPNVIPCVTTSTPSMPSPTTYEASTISATTFLHLVFDIFEKQTHTHKWMKKTDWF